MSRSVKAEHVEPLESLAAYPRAGSGYPRSGASIDPAEHALRATTAAVAGDLSLSERRSRRAGLYGNPPITGTDAAAERDASPPAQERTRPDRSPEQVVRK